MVIKKASLEAVAAVEKQFPETGLCEIAFIGKSNVGKSSLINALTGRKALARTSQSPGKTRTINFYNINDLLFLVDLPGYGYAKVSQAEQKKWGQVIESYLQTRKQLKESVLLIDIRHEPSAGDKMMYDWMTYYGIEPLIIATKRDKISKNQLQKQLAVIRKSLGIDHMDRIIPVSSETKEGIEQVWEHIEKTIGLDQPFSSEIR